MRAHGELPQGAGARTCTSGLFGVVILLIQGHGRQPSLQAKARVVVHYSRSARRAVALYFFSLERSTLGGNTSPLSLPSSLLLLMPIFSVALLNTYTQEASNDVGIVADSVTVLFIADVVSALLSFGDDGACCAVPKIA